jgi:activator of the mannose operon, transcriptional antiterminator
MLDRVFRIMDLLLKSKGPMTIDSIADCLNVSNRTVRYDLLKVEEYIQEKGLHLTKKPGIGVQLEGLKKNRLKVLNELKIGGASVEAYSPQDRKNKILKKLFMLEKNVTINGLAKELYVSEVTVQKDLKDIEKWVEAFSLKLVKRTNQGVRITGEEENFRNAMASLIASNMEYDELKKMLDKDQYLRIDHSTACKLKELVDIDYHKLEKIVGSAEENIGYKFTDEAFIALIIHIAISIKRLQDKKDIIFSSYELSDFKNNAEYKVAEKLAEDIYKYFQIQLPEQEVGYIFLHILGSKLQQDSTNEIELKLQGELDSELAVVMAKEILSITEKVLSIDLRKDKQALNALILHLRPTINRLKYGLNLKNPILEEIKQNYPDIYGVAWITSSVFEKYLSKKISEDEIGYIALHLGAAIERQKKPIRTLVVCPSGMGTSQFLAVRLEKYFKELDIRNVSSINSLNAISLGEVDLIISTVPINTAKPILIISPLLTSKDIGDIKGFINSFGKASSNSLINEELIEINALYESKEEAIHSMSLKLIEKGFVKNDFEQSILRREKVSSTGIGKGIAIAHGFPDSVKQSQIALAILKKPVCWGTEEYVDIIFLLALSDVDIKNSVDALRSLYRELDSDRFIQYLKAAKDTREIKDILININI